MISTYLNEKSGGVESLPDFLIFLYFDFLMFSAAERSKSHQCYVLLPTFELDITKLLVHTIIRKKFRMVS